MAKTKATHHVVFILAQIHGPECADMLRYDACVPANEENAHKMSQAMSSGEATWVIFRRFVALGAPTEPTVGRWKSFNIPCVNQEFKDYDSAADFFTTLEAKRAV